MATKRGGFVAKRCPNRANGHKKGKFVAKR